MDRNFADHSANERTYLAWVRTAVALFGFGIIVERIEIIAKATDPSVDIVAISAEIAAVCMLLLGVAILGVATLRFHRHSRQIDMEKPSTYRSPFMVNAMSFATALFALIMLIYAVQLLL